MHEDPALNALSRRDNKTYICPPCGNDEAMHDFKLALTRANESRWLEGASDKEEE
jgi:hypothetical protein